jgi:hypothetical protein
MINTDPRAHTAELPSVNTTRIVPGPRSDDHHVVTPAALRTASNVIATDFDLALLITLFNMRE